MKNLPEQFAGSMRSLGIQSSDKLILLAVSGGPDSMVMLNLFYRLGYRCHVAHCNFGLRGDDSNADEELVRQTAAHYRFPFHTHYFSTAEYANEHGLSIQMAARELRYRWFEEIAEENVIEYIATAHHADDVAETVLLNLVRGAGLAGMHGIRKVNAKRIRPLLFATRAELEEYAEKNHLKWRHDLSNNENYYKRNKIRNQVMPVLRELNPTVNLAITNHAFLMEGYEKLIDDYLNLIQPDLTKEHYNGSIKTISLEKLKTTSSPEAILYHLLKPFGAPASFSLEILSSGTGSEFHANGYRMVRDRNELTVFAPDTGDDQVYLIETGNENLELKYGKLTIRECELQGGSDLKSLPGFSDRQVAYIDSVSIKYPLTVRRWHAGDRFQPMGMNGTRLLSDYFTDEKFSSEMKEVVYLLMSENRVVWVAGHRIGEPFRLQSDTTHITLFTFLPNS